MQKKGQMSQSLMVALIIGLFVAVVIVLMMTGYGEKVKDTAPFDDSEAKMKDAMHDKKCAMECTAHCIDSAYAVSGECYNYIFTKSCCNCESADDITEGCDDGWED